MEENKARRHLLSPCSAISGFQFSPIYGKVALNGRRIVNFDVFAAFGLGLTLTQDDLEALGDDSAEGTGHTKPVAPHHQHWRQCEQLQRQYAFRLEGLLGLHRDHRLENA